MTRSFSRTIAPTTRGVALDALLAPCGVAYRRVFADHGDAFLHSAKDKEHVNFNGHYLFAACIAAAISGKSPVVGNDVKRISLQDYAEGGYLKAKSKTPELPAEPQGPSTYTEEEAKYLQTVAWDAYVEAAKDMDEIKKRDAHRK